MRGLALALLVACSGDHGPRHGRAGRTTPHDGGTLHVSTLDSVRTLDPSVANDVTSIYMIHALFDTLVDYAPGSIELVPRLAASWEISGDGLTYHFTLKPGLRYSDGTPVVAADLAYSLARAHAKDSVSQQYVADIASVEAPGDRELTIRLARPNAAFLNILAMPFTTPQREAYVARAGTSIGRAPLGIGPFVLASWDDDTLVLRRNPSYYDPTRAHLDAIELREQLEPDVAFLAFERGDLDIVDHLTAPDTQWVASQIAWKPYIKRHAQLGAFGYRMNVKRAPFDDPRVRRAFNLADDKTHVIKLLSGTAEAAHGVLPPGVLGRDDELAPYPHDPAAARRLLEDAHYDFDRDLAIVTYDDDEPRRLAGSLRADLAAIGVRAHVDVISFAAWATTAMSPDPDGPELALATQACDSPDPSSCLDAVFASDGEQNGANYANPAVDALLAEARATLDSARRTALYHRVERLLYDDAPWIWEYHRTTVEVAQPYVIAYDLHPVWIRDFVPVWLDQAGEAGER